MTETGIVCYADVYGYSADASGRGAEKSAKRLFAMWQDVSSKISKNKRSSLMAFSDSIFVGFDTSEEDPSIIFERDVVSEINEVLKLASVHGYLLRGSAAYGKYIISNNVVGGDAVIRAHKFESIVRAPLFHVPLSEIVLINEKSSEKLPFTCKELATRGGGLIKSMVIHPTPIDDYVDRLNRSLEKAYLNNAYEAAAALKDALNAIK